MAADTILLILCAIAALILLLRLIYSDIKHLGKTSKTMTVRQLKELLADTPDDYKAIVTVDFGYWTEYDPEAKEQKEIRTMRITAEIQDEDDQL